MIGGFGNHTPGERRLTQYRSIWDIVHPGRAWVLKFKPRTETQEQLLADIVNHLKTVLLPQVPSSVASYKQVVQGQNPELVISACCDEAGSSMLTILISTKESGTWNNAFQVPFSFAAFADHPPHHRLHFSGPPHRSKGGAGPEMHGSARQATIACQESFAWATYI
ncbi:MAG TPA: Eco29kI family restriction endonuclease [Humidesulfovibrio sp.]|uniref:Eco29kI family restriction endonuclease n=1 Tax=Humidesulfovibrio sp. TaxID=2910988 RepID=UPI002D0CE414|nr:Eco29kI family restriction endonuclease [Humidesulfovibrio sp.]HWR03750.1 Eco29kI family restriction endonuclease [Humidesulfovibrio sp.]